MKLLTRSLTLSVLTLSGLAAHAEDLPCATDLVTYCKDAGAKGPKGHIQCLMDHIQEVNEACRASLEADKHEGLKQVKEILADQKAAREAQDQEIPQEFADILNYWKDKKREDLPANDGGGCGRQLKDTCQDALKGASPGEKKTAFVACILKNSESYTPRCRFTLTKRASKWVEEGRARLPSSLVIQPIAQ